MVKPHLFTVAFAVILTLTTWVSISPTHADPLYTNDNVRKLVVIGKIRGYVLASIADWETGQYDLAIEHTDQIGEELSSIIAVSLKQANLQDAYQTSLENYAKIVGSAGDKDTVQKAFDKLTAVLDKAGKAFAPATAFDDPGFRLSVGQGLLAGVAEEYGEGVADGKLVEPIAYQEAVGFYQVVKEHYLAI